MLLLLHSTCGEAAAIAKHQLKAKQKKAEQKYAECAALKQRQEEDSPWYGSKALLGFVVNTGNTREINLSAELNIDYTFDRWNDVAQLNSQFGSSFGEVNKERYYAQNQLNYSLNDNKKYNNYLYASGNITFDRFSPYSYQSVTSIGYGRDWIRTDRFRFAVQAGPGFRFNQVRSSKLVQNDFVITTTTLISWKIFKWSTLSEILRYDYGRPFSYIRSVTAFTNKITGHLAVQISYMIDYYSKIPVGSTNTQNLDTTTNVALVYNF